MHSDGCCLNEGTRKSDSHGAPRVRHGMDPQPSANQRNHGEKWAFARNAGDAAQRYFVDRHMRRVELVP